MLDGEGVQYSYTVQSSDFTAVRDPRDSNPKVRKIALYGILNLQHFQLA